uniref:Solute-binding protein family 5 domain-containing protein n=1 Tax=candidate division WOR-3 bacterium TaxID=2052148 RepID=A0A7C4XJ30_UNCW3
MARILREYLNNTRNFIRCVEELTQFLNYYNLKLEIFIEKMESLSKLFQRSDTILKMVKEFTVNFKAEIFELRNIFSENGTIIKKTRDKILNLNELFKFIIEALKNLEENAREIMQKFQLLRPLSQNTEITAIHSKNEGRGLAIIAREINHLVALSQKQFEEFDTSLKNLRKISQTVVVDLKKSTEVSDISSEIFLKAIESLQKIDDLNKSIQKITTRVESGLDTFSTLQRGISEKLATMKEQLFKSLNMVDKISTETSEVNSLAQILNDLYILNSRTGLNVPTVNIQFNYLLNENLAALNKISAGSLPVFSLESVYSETNKIIKQILVLNEMSNDTKKLSEELLQVMSEIIRFQGQIEKYFTEVKDLFTSLKECGKILTAEMFSLEKVIFGSAKVFSKIRMLSIFARLEEGRSLKSQSIITPVVRELSKLSSETQILFTALENMTGRLKKSAIELSNVSLEESPRFKTPDYTRIKLFFDDLSRIFEEKMIYNREINEIIEEFRQNNLFLNRLWEEYGSSTRRVIELSEKLKSLITEPQNLPSILRNRKVIRSHLSSDPLTLKGDQKTDANSHQVIVNSLTGLFQFGKGVDVIPGLCEDYEISADGLEYTFRIKRDLRYGNGQRLRIEDVKEGLIRALSGPNANFFEMIKGTEEFLKTKNPDVLGIKILDPQTIKIELEYPFLPILANLATNVADPYIDGEYPIGTGPFRVSEWEKNKRISLVANEFYYEGRPSIDELEFLIIKDDDHCYELFKKGALSIYRPGEKNLKKIKSETPELLFTVPELSIQYLAFNCQKFPFNNRLVRQAINFAIDREKMVEKFLRESAIPARGIFPPSIRVYNDKLKLYSYDPSKSRELLNQAGFPNGLPDIYPLDVSDSLTTIRRAEFISSALSEIGIKITINPLPWKVLLEKSYQGNSLLSLQGWVGDNGDPDNFLYPLFHTKSFGYPGNTFFFSEPEIDEMLEQARKIRNLSQRIDYYRTLEEKILKEAPGVFLYHSLENVAIQREVLGISPHPLSLIRAKYACILENEAGIIEADNIPQAGEMYYERHHFAQTKI